MNKQSIEKICVPRLVERLNATIDKNGEHFLDNVDVGGIILKSEYKSLNLLYILGLLNSNLLQWYFPFVSAPFRGGWLSANRQFLSKLPIRMIDFKNTSDVKYHNKMINLVNDIIELNERLNLKKTEQGIIILKRQIDMVEQQINELTYELYNLNKEEIKVVESVAID